MQLVPLSFPGCFRILPKRVVDVRGMFVKPFVASEYQQAGLATVFEEEYYSHSGRGVIRGLHFQTPPFEGVKVVSCIYGKLKDVIVDLRVGSPTFQEAEVIPLDAAEGQLLYLPPGIAHGFLAESENVVVLYKTSTPYSPTHDVGIRWDSVPVDWGVSNPLVSDRDRSFPALADFKSPFVFQVGQHGG